MFYADTIGLPTLLDGMLKYQGIYGPMHWQPAPLLKELVKSGQSIAQWEASRRERT
jgi:3-hydroxyacyl-CoA dehydrogenase